MGKVRPRNDRLASLLAEAELGHAHVARLFVHVALECGATDLAGVGRSHVSHSVAGTRPSGRAPLILLEALARQVGRTLTLHDIGLSDAMPLTQRTYVQDPDWHVDTPTHLAELGRDDVDVSAAVFSRRPHTRWQRLPYPPSPGGSEWPPIAGLSRAGGRHP